MPPVIIDIGTDEDAGEWLRALPYVHFPVSDHTPRDTAEAFKAVGCDRVSHDKGISE